MWTQPANVHCSLANDSMIPIWNWQFEVSSLWGQRDRLAGLVKEEVGRRMAERAMRKGSSDAV